MARLELDRVVKRYDTQTVAVRGVSLDVADGEFMVFLGPSGCGKSTTLRMIAGLESVSEGSIRVGDRVVNDVPPKDRNIAMVFQNYALFPHMTVFENLAFGLRMRKAPKSEIQKRVGEAARTLGIDGLMERRPGALSGGERQRVALGRALVREPSVFLFDEPLSNLDAKLRGQMRYELTKLQRDLRATVVYVTHDQVEAMTMGDRIAIMNQGIIEQVAAPSVLYRNPATKFVAEFVGIPPMNFWAGRFVHDGQAISFELRGVGQGQRFPLPTIWDPRVSESAREVTLGLRPEHIQLRVSPPDSGSTWSVVEIEFVEHRGADSYARFTLHGVSTLARLTPGNAVERGDSCEVALELEHACFFDEATGNALLRND